MSPGSLSLVYLDLKKPSILRKRVNTSELILKILKALIPPALLVLAVLGSILGGLATPTEAASFGGVGAMLLAILKGQLNRNVMVEVIRMTTKISCMVLGFY